MALTKPDETCALVVIDLQKGIGGLPTAYPADEIVDRSVQLARAFRERGLPVILVNVSGSAAGRTDAGNLRRRGVTQVVLTGVARRFFPGWVRRPGPMTC